MPYELMDVETANLVGRYETEIEALIEVRALLRANGTAYAQALALAYEDRRGRGRLVAEGSTLAERAAAAQEAQRKRISA